jgi:deoxyribose-phosphate aldolase
MITVEQIAKMIDHSILNPAFTDEDLISNCKTARKYDVATVCVKPYHTKMAAELMKGSSVVICAVIGFPHGNSTIEIKMQNVTGNKRRGTEVDMVLNIGKVLQHDWDYINENR